MFKVWSISSWKIFLWEIRIKLTSLELKRTFVHWLHIALVTSRLKWIIHCKYKNTKFIAHMSFHAVAEVISVTPPSTPSSCFEWNDTIHGIVIYNQLNEIRFWSLNPLIWGNYAIFLQLQKLTAYSLIWWNRDNFNYLNHFEFFYHAYL